MKYRLKMNPQGQVYLPKEIRETLFEGKTELEFYPNLRVGIIAPAELDPKTVIGSLEILRQHFEQIAGEKKDDKPKKK